MSASTVNRVLLWIFVGCGLAELWSGVRCLVDGEWALGVALLFVAAFAAVGAWFTHEDIKWGDQ